MPLNPKLGANFHNGKKLLFKFKFHKDATTLTFPFWFLHVCLPLLRGSIAVTLFWDLFEDYPEIPSTANMFEIYYHIMVDTSVMILHVWCYLFPPSRCFSKITLNSQMLHLPWSIRRLWVYHPKVIPLPLKTLCP